MTTWSTVFVYALFQSSTGLSPGCYKTASSGYDTTENVSILNRAFARLLRLIYGTALSLTFQSSTGLSPGCYDGLLVSAGLELKFQSSTGFRPVATPQGPRRRSGRSCFNPQPGFPPVATRVGHSFATHQLQCFNPQPGFRPVATAVPHDEPATEMFQSSTGFSPGCYRREHDVVGHQAVSILNRGFPRLLHGGSSHRRSSAGFNPQPGFRPVATPNILPVSRGVIPFQSSTGLAPGCYKPSPFAPMMQREVSILNRGFARLLRTRRKTSPSSSAFQSSTGFSPGCYVFPPGSAGSF